MDGKGHASIKTFILIEIEPVDAYLQNQRLGWNTDGSNYKAEYETSHGIYLGESVTLKTDIAPYEIWANGNITCTAEVEINISNGFHAKAGSEFHAKIAAVNYTSICNQGMAPMNNDAEYSQSAIEQENNFLQETKFANQNSAFIIVPNPSNSDAGFQIIGETTAELKINIFNLAGQQVYFGQEKTNATINANLLPGIYVITIDKVRKQQVKN